MQITRIDFEGETGRYATAQRRAGGGQNPDVIEITLLPPDRPGGQRHLVAVDCENELRSMARSLQRQLDGWEGSNSEVHGYYLELLRLSDC
jgi:hypothetical protein